MRKAKSGRARLEIGIIILRGRQKEQFFKRKNSFSGDFPNDFQAADQVLPRMENHEFWGETFPPIQIVAEDKDFLAIIITKFKKCIILLRDYADPDQPVFGAGSNLTRA